MAEVRAITPSRRGSRLPELSDHLFGKAVAEVLLVGVPAQVLEGENDEHALALPRTTGGVADPDDQGRDRDHRHGHEPEASRRCRCRGWRRHLGGRWRRRDLPIEPRHRCYEPVAAARHGLDEPGALGRVSQDLADPVDGLVHALVEVHEDVRRPQLLAQLLTGHDLARTGEKHGKDLERLTL